MSTLHERLREIEKLASWHPPQQEKIQALVDECQSIHPDSASDIQVRILRGEEAGRLLQPLYDIGCRSGRDSNEAKKALSELESQRPDLVNLARHRLEKGHAARKRRQDVNKRKRKGKPASQVAARQIESRSPQTPSTLPHKELLPTPAIRGLHPLDIRGLKPSSKWTLLVDETGSIFDELSEKVRKNDPKLGRLVGLLLPEGHDLRPLKPGWHAVDQGIDQIDAVIQAVLDSSVGVLGINVQQLPSVPAERWALGILRLIDLVLRLLPLSDATTLTVQIENRGEFTRNMEWPAVSQDVMLRLSHGYPERAKLIACSIQVIGKYDSSFNGYVDALAYIWAAASDYSRACLKQTGLEGTCFLPGNAEAISRAWEWLDRGVTLDGADWATLLAQPEADTLGSLTGTILERLGQASQSNVELWHRYLGYTLDHIASKAVDLKMLGRQVEWLEHWSPRGQLLPPPARLLWLTAKLARANHYGQTEQPWMAELSGIGDQLLEENAHLVCRAELILAVNATNRYEFDLASQLLARWQDLPKSVPGLRHWAQVQSSLGQHAAFRSNYHEAIRYFDLALEAFTRLTDEKQGSEESVQTLTYRAIALMDYPNADFGDVQAAVEKVTGPIGLAISQLAGQVDDRDKYRHHLLIRWLALRASEEQRSRYLSLRESWHVGEGFPWPLIQLYRGLLIKQEDPKAALELAVDAYCLATDVAQGPTMHLIGACCRAIAHAWGEDWADPETELEPLSAQLPAAVTRVNRLREYLSNPTEDPKVLLRTVLPFNFH